jgi:hypothetical protein
MRGGLGWKAGLRPRLAARKWALPATLVSPVGKPFLSLAQRLALFDPQRHGGEAMVTGRIGREVV